MAHPHEQDTPATASGSSSSSSLLLALDSASLLSVLAALPLPDLASAACSCRRVSEVCRGNNSLFLNLIQHHFGLVVHSSQHATPGAAAVLLRRLRCALRHALPAKAVATDGGCDQPATDYWASNMFAPTRTALYCSEAATSNVHVWARLVPAAEAAPSSAGEAAAAPQQPLIVPAAQLFGDDPRRLRSYLLERCLWPAVELITPAATAAATAAILAALQGASHSSAGASDAPAGADGGEGADGPGCMSAVLRCLATSSAHHAVLQQGGSRSPAAQRQLAAAAVLSSLSTAGLIELFMCCYVAFEQQRGWARSLLKGLTSDSDLQAVHTCMFALWADRLGNRRERHQLLSVAPPPAASSSTAGGGGGSSSAPRVAAQRAPPSAPAPLQQQPQRPLLCDKDQLLALADSAGSHRNTCIVHEVLVSRGNVHAATCPMLSGVLFLGCRTAGAMPPPPAAAAGAGGAGGGAPPRAGAAAAAAAQHIAAELAAQAQQPWVAAAANLTSPAAVFGAVAAGLLPPVVRFQRSSAAVWIEFDRPTPAQLAREAQAAGAGAGAGGVLAGHVLAPALWWRFHTQEELRREAAPGDDQQPAGAGAGPAAPAAAPGGDQGGGGGLEVLLHYPHLAGLGDIDLNANAGPAEDADNGNPAGDAPPPAAAAAPVAAPQQAPAAPVPAPVPVSPPPLCAQEPELPTCAVEASAALGWRPSGPRQAMMLSITLQLPRPASSVCVVLLDSEDRNPAFNQGRGGCNIDAELVLCRGQDLLDLPAGLSVAGLPVRD